MNNLLKNKKFIEIIKKIKKERYRQINLSIFRNILNISCFSYDHDITYTFNVIFEGDMSKKHINFDHFIKIIETNQDINSLECLEQSPEIEGIKLTANDKLVVECSTTEIKKFNNYNQLFKLNLKNDYNRPYLDGLFISNDFSFISNGKMFIQDFGFTANHGFKIQIPSEQIAFINKYIKDTYHINVYQNGNINKLVISGNHKDYSFKIYLTYNIESYNKEWIKEDHDPMKIALDILEKQNKLIEKEITLNTSVIKNILDNKINDDKHVFIEQIGASFSEVYLKLLLKIIGNDKNIKINILKDQKNQPMYIHFENLAILLMCVKV